MAGEIQDWLRNRFPCQKAESPIEALFHAAWSAMKPHSMAIDEVRLTPQADLGNYRADFLFTINDVEGKEQKLVVEMDGHDFHERTKAQAAHDKARDRWMTGEGYQVMRFTGSEVWRNPFQVVEEVVSRLHMLRYGESEKRARARAGFEALRKLLES